MTQEFQDLLEIITAVGERVARLEELIAQVNSALAQETAPRTKKAHPKSIPSGVAEVAEYCHSRSNAVDPQQFHDHYQARGWCYGPGKPMRDWQAAVRTWERSTYGTGRGAQAGAAPGKLQQQAISFLTPKPSFFQPRTDGH